MPWIIIHDPSTLGSSTWDYSPSHLHSSAIPSLLPKACLFTYRADLPVL